MTQAARLNASLAQWARVQGMDQLMLSLARKFYKGWDKRGEAMQTELRKVMSPASASAGSAPPRRTSSASSTSLARC